MYPIFRRFTTLPTVTFIREPSHPSLHSRHLHYYVKVTRHSREVRGREKVMINLLVFGGHLKITIMKTLTPSFVT